MGVCARSMPCFEYKYYQFTIYQKPFHRLISETFHIVFEPKSQTPKWIALPVQLSQPASHPARFRWVQIGARAGTGAGTETQTGTGLFQVRVISDFITGQPKSFHFCSVCFCVWPGKVSETFSTQNKLKFSIFLRMPRPCWLLFAGPSAATWQRLPFVRWQIDFLSCPQTNQYGKIQQSLYLRQVELLWLPPSLKETQGFSPDQRAFEAYSLKVQVIAYRRLCQ